MTRVFITADAYNLIQPSCLHRLEWVGVIRRALRLVWCCWLAARTRHQRSSWRR
jgi:hypothetical protein